MEATDTVALYEAINENNRSLVEVMFCSDWDASHVRKWVIKTLVSRGMRLSTVSRLFRIKLQSVWRIVHDLKPKPKVASFFENNRPLHGSDGGGGREEDGGGGEGLHQEDEG